MEIEKEEVEIEAQAKNVDPNLGFDKNEVKEKSREERVVVEEPKEKFNISTGAISLMLSVGAIALSLFAMLFAIVGVVVMYQIFMWLGTFCLFGTLGLFIYDIIRNKKLEFSPAFLLMLLSAFIVCLCF
ncbi:MAG: hypothetical protein IJ301_05930 [Clostridia bacterium]|nr:hypothetical protein [Clostridia bacterium]